METLELWKSSEYKNILFEGAYGSSLAVYSSLALNTTKKPNIFILKDKEEASYFINDLENILEKKILFFSESYRRT